ncbi:MAG: Hsp20/alpha crystallin family protein [Kovacikia sp.]
MATMRRQPWQEMEVLRRQMDQLFDELLPLNQNASLAIANQKTWIPAIELKNTDTDIILRAELPGLNGKDLNIQVTREAVLISGESKLETKTDSESGTRRTVRSEFRYGKFQRVIPLPAAIYNERIQAEFKDGILTLTLPKVEADRPKVVKVNLNGAQPLPVAESKAESKPDQPPATTEQTETGDVWAEVA